MSIVPRSPCDTMESNRDRAPPLVLIPMGGSDAAFRRHGYATPRGLIPVKGRPMLFHILDVLPPQTHVRLLCEWEYRRYRIHERALQTFPGLVIETIYHREQTRGAAETVYNGMRGDTEERAVLCMDCDTLYRRRDIMGLWKQENAIFVFRNTDNVTQYSYVTVNESLVTQITEKQPISDLACSGAYGFASIAKLREYCALIIRDNQRACGEFYLSTVIQRMIEEGSRFRACTLNSTDVINLGSPLQLRIGAPIVSYERRMRLCFDLDGTLVSAPTVKGDYSTVTPIAENIHFLRRMRSLGHTIIIYTGREMDTLGANVGRITATVGMVTMQTLASLEIPYDELVFGKPHADVFIDCNAVNACDDLQRSTGFYDDAIDPRSFHALSKQTVQTIRKQGADLSAEINYYRAIPGEVRHLFPSLVMYDTRQYRWYDMEFIKGVPVSMLFVSGLLSPHHLRTILAALDQIHAVRPAAGHGWDVYANYASKLQSRYRQSPAVYAPLEGSETLLGKLIRKLEEYALKGRGMCAMIHGDPVFTNILLEHDSRSLRFLDPRGRLGETQTIFGDVLYDWAKVYQSLIGYDEVLMDKPRVAAEYRSMLLEVFTEHVGASLMDDVKTITSSLIFSLLPLHDQGVVTRCWGLLQSLSF